jgi:hypothetical protein
MLSCPGMTTQPAPNVTHADVERIVRRDFGAERAAEVLALLEGYGPERWHRHPERVRLACLKLAHGELDRLRAQIENAQYDYRDVIGAAEYPGYMKRMFHIEKLPEEERQEIIDGDWRQYQDWLNR